MIYWSVFWLFLAISCSDYPTHVSFMLVVSLLIEITFEVCVLMDTIV